MKHMLTPWHTLAVLLAAAGLAACEPSPPTPKAQGDAAPSAPAVSVAPQESAPAPKAGGDAVQGLNADAATVAASADNVDELPSYAQPSSSASPLGELRSYVGTYPSDSNVSFLEQGVLAERLKRLLGKEYGTLLTNMRTVSPLAEDAGRWFITGNHPHEGGKEAAAIVVDAAQNAIRVWMLHEGKVSQYQDPIHVTVPWPRDVQTMVDNASSAPRS